MIAHDRVGTEFHTEERGEQSNPVFNPAAPVFEALAGVVVDTAEEGAAHAAGCDVVVGGLGQADQVFAGARHGEDSTGAVTSERGE